jgi:hypothetical protein
MKKSPAEAALRLQLQLHMYLGGHNRLLVTRIGWLGWLQHKLISST